MHVIFGVSGLAMLGTTIWMLAADHDREWKDYQRKFRKVEAWTTQSRLDAERTGRVRSQARRARSSRRTQAQQRRRRDRRTGRRSSSTGVEKQRQVTEAERRGR